MNNMHHSITVTPQTFKRISALTEIGMEDAGKKLRVSVNSGGCSGFQYDYLFTDLINEADIVIKDGTSIVVIDPISVQFLDNATIDYKETLGFAQFEITNPKAQSKCGCGNSFSV